MSIKVFQIGFNKCGTRSIHRFLRAGGLKGVHWDRGNLAKTMYRNLTEGRSLLEGYEEFSAFSDMEHVSHEFAFEAYKLFPLLALEFPEAIFILNTRNREDWIKSRFSHSGGLYARRWKSVLGLQDEEKLAERWREDWEWHHNRAVDFFAHGNCRFFVFKLGVDEPDVFAKMIPECKFDISRFPVAGRTSDRKLSTMPVLGL